MDGDLRDLLCLDEIDTNLYRAAHLVDEPFPLYGGQVAAQSLLAAIGTVDAGRAPHSLHGYFLRPGDAMRPTVFQVFRDRDGRSFSARRVVALQRGEVIFSMAASFHGAGFGANHQAWDMPVVDSPAESRPYAIPRLASHEGRMVRQRQAATRYPERFWARCTADLSGDQHLAYAALAYLSDISSGLVTVEDEENQGGPSLDHAVWFHRQVEPGQWLLSATEPVETSSGIGLYTGGLFAEDGTHVASIAQQTLFGRRSGRRSG